MNGTELRKMIYATGKRTFSYTDNNRGFNNTNGGKYARKTDN